jgi:hypothetical protein
MLLLKIINLLFSAQDPHLIRGRGLANHGLSDEQRTLVQRFDPINLGNSADQDCIGFFIAKFVKRPIKTV